MLHLTDIQPGLCSCIEVCLDQRDSWFCKKKNVICSLAERGNPLHTSEDFKATPQEMTFSEGPDPVTRLRQRERTPQVIAESLFSVL